MSAAQPSEQVVWFKRDLRVDDHVPLRQAANAGTCRCVFVIEPELLRQPETDAAQWAPVLSALWALDDELRARGGALELMIGALPELFARLHAARPFAAIWAHEEVGNGRTYARDRRVRAWARAAGVALHEAPQPGVVRGRTRPARFASGWRDAMMQPCVVAPARIHGPPAAIPHELRPRWWAATERPPGSRAPDGWLRASLAALAQHGLAPSTKPLTRACMSSARQQLRAALDAHGEHEHARQHAEAAPVSARLELRASSRLSVHLALGTLSPRTAAHAIAQARESAPPAQAATLAGLEQRLRWRSHFTQKLENEPDLEFLNLDRSCDGLREAAFDRARFDAWREGRTGAPLVDACMRALQASGWLPFRMRALLVAYASYQLWLHWRPTAIVLARHFVDFEPGIHFPQVQMQAGTTGINALRMYLPRKQQRAVDPDGAFVRRWVPELRGVPLDHLDAPWTLPLTLQHRAGCVIGRDYPAPVVDDAQALAHARRELAAARARSAATGTGADVLRRHGARRTGLPAPHRPDGREGRR